MKVQRVVIRFTESWITVRGGIDGGVVIANRSFVCWHCYGRSTESERLYYGRNTIIFTTVTFDWNRSIDRAVQHAASCEISDVGVRLAGFISVCR